MSELLVEAHFRLNAGYESRLIQYRVKYFNITYILELVLLLAWVNIGDLKFLELL